MDNTRDEFEGVDITQSEGPNIEEGDDLQTQLGTPGDAGVPEDGAFDGDANGGNDAMPEGDGQPPMDGGVMGAVGNNGVPPSTPDTGVNDKAAGSIPPEEAGR